jgi:hypothetical protein
MTHTLPLVARTALAVCASTALLAAPVFAQATNQGSSGADRGAARAEGGGGGAPAAAPHASSSPSAPSGGNTGGNSGGGSATAGGGSTTGGGGYGVSRSGGDRSGSGARATGGSGSGGGYTGSNAPAQGAGGHQGTGRAVPRDGGTVTGTSKGSSGDVPTYARPRDGHAPVGNAVPRGTVPPPATGGGGAIYVPGYYPGGYYDPWGYAGYGAGYGGYYGGYYDPWYGGYPTTPQATYSSSSDEGALKLKIKPRQAEVYVDGYFVGVVDDFDGMFQRLHIESGTHRIEVRASGYENLDFDVRITPEHTTTYTGEMKKIQ